MFRMFGDECTPALFGASQFEVVSDAIPSAWRVRRVGDSLLLLEPEAWLTPGFWEAYFNLDPEAERIFEKIFQELVDEQAARSPTFTQRNWKPDPL